MKIVLTAGLIGLLLGTSQSHAQADLSHGETIFKKCQACHAIGADARNKAGPILNGIVGRQAATVEGFKYSKAFEDAGAAGLIWTLDELRTFIEAPRLAVPGTRMSFAGIKNAADLDDLLAYLAVIGPDGARGDR